MKTHPLPSLSRIDAFGRLLVAALGVWLLGAVYAPPVMAATATVSVSQSPLTLQPTIPPNVVLMLDDSGSMAWDFMPDACYLYGVTCTQTPAGYYGNSPSSATCQNGTSPINNVGNGTGQCVDVISAVNNSAVIDATNNGVYYDPAVAYAPPPTASGGNYPTQTGFPVVPLDGFGTVSGSAILTAYSSSDVTGEDNGDHYPIKYSYISSTATVSGTFDQVVTSQGSWWSPIYADQVCQNDFTSDGGTGTGPTFTGTQQDRYGNWLAGTCVFTGTKVPAVYFQYSTGPAAGPYTVHYVAPAGQGCVADGTVSAGNCVAASDTSGVAAPNKDANGSPLKDNVGNLLTAGENIANWFAYYHTRIQMAKSGLMTAFSTVDKTFRIGFGSIDGDYSSQYYYPGLSANNSNLPALKYSYADAYNNGTNYIAEVQPFGDGSSTTDQKNNFWKWLAPLTPKGGTPLRQALDAVGQYYSGTDSTSPASNAWDTMSSDPGYVAGGSNSTIACRQSYTILTTDGFWNGNYTSSATKGASDTTGQTVTGPNGQSYQYTPTAFYSGGDAVDASGSATPSLADVAMYYWENDLQASIGNEVPPSTQDPAFWQHMTTFTMGLGFQPLGISGTAPNNDNPPTTTDIANWMNDGGSATSKYAISNFSWPTSPNGPAPNSAYNISDLEHAGVNGHGGFYSATNPGTFTGGMQDAFNRATERVGTGASLAANSTQLTNGTVAYQANYYTALWTGDLKALAINSSTGAIATTPSWSAATMLPSAANRNIVTYNPSATGAAQWPAFQNSSTGAPPALSVAELNALGGTTAAQAAMVNYLRGDSTLGSSYRSRKTPLGDIVDSQPVYSGAPNSNEFEGETFTGITSTSTSCDSSFLAFTGGDAGTTTTACVDASTRTPMVFVAGNDGMLHAFNASSGAEVFAYLPGAVITGDVGVNASATSATSFDNTALATLANPGYGSTTGSAPHQFYNDGELTIADAFFNSAWHTVLVGTTGRGPAKAVYALDITKATVSSTGQLSGITPLWERSALDGQTNSTYIGQMVGKPVIAKVQDGTTNSDWQVLIGNGYNSASGKAALLEFNLATGALTVHTATNRSGITTGNGLAAPVAWMDYPAFGISDVAYAGDLQGQVWRFPLATVTTSGGNGNNQTTTFTPDPSILGSSTPVTDGFVVFTTPGVDSSGNPLQPITGGMLAGSDPATSNVWLFFGTGQYLNSNDLTNRQVQSWYGVIAQHGGAFATSAVAQTSLVQRSITYEADGSTTATPPTLGVRTITTNTDAPNGGALTSSQSGWYINLQAPTGASGAYVNQGERIVTSNQFQGNLLLATTRIPIVTDICNPSGSGWVIAVNPFTGTNPTSSFYQVNGGTTVTITVGGKNETVPVAGVGFSALPNNPIFVGSDMLMSFDNGGTSNVNTTGSTGGPSRVSWQELVNP